LHSRSTKKNLGQDLPYALDTQLKVAPKCLIKGVERGLYMPKDIKQKTMEHLA